MKRGAEAMQNPANLHRDMARGGMATYTDRLAANR